MQTKTMRELKLNEKSKTKIPKAVQELIPITAVYPDGTFLLKAKENGLSQFSMTYKFDDVNFALLDKDGEQRFLKLYSDVINSFEPGNRYKITLIKRKVNEEEIRKNLMMELKGDKNDYLRKEYNDIIMEKATAANGVVLEFYITITTFKKDYESAKQYFSNQKNIINTTMRRIGSRLDELNAKHRLSLLRDFYRDDVENEDLNLNVKELNQRGIDFKDLIAPKYYQREFDYFKLGDNFGRSLFVKENGYGNYIRTDTIAKLCAIDTTMALSIDLVPISTEEAAKAAEDAKMKAESNKMKYLKKAYSQKQFGAEVPYEQRLQIEEADEWLTDIRERDQRIFFANITMTHLAPTLEDLNADTTDIISQGRTLYLQLTKGILEQQLDGLHTSLPIGVNEINSLRTLSTEGVCAFNPFRAREITHSGGIYFGTNAITGNIISVNTNMLTNPNCFIAGIPGSGKSMSIKFLLLFLGLSTDYEIIILDPENEFSKIVEQLNGKVIDLSTGKNNHINAMDMSFDENDGGIQAAITDKTQFMLSIMEQMDKNTPLTAQDNSLINRVIIELYSNSDIKEKTMVEFKKLLEKQGDKRSKELALRIEMFTTGSLDTFAHETNVDMNSRITSFNLYGLGEMEKKVGMVTVADALVNRVTKNFKEGKKTYVIADEFQEMLKDEYTSRFFCTAWKRWRKRGGIPIGITQNIRYLLDSAETRDMLGNSPFVLLFQMAETDIPALKELYHLSAEEQKFISSTILPGNGLMKVGGDFEPFENQIPKDSEIYKLLTTRVEEGFTTF